MMLALASIGVLVVKESAFDPTQWMLILVSVVNLLDFVEMHMLKRMNMPAVELPGTFFFASFDDLIY